MGLSDFFAASRSTVFWTPAAHRYLAPRNPFFFGGGSSCSCWYLAGVAPRAGGYRQ